MELFSTILRKILYPQNNLEELRKAYVFPNIVVSNMFSVSMDNVNAITIYKNPKYKNHVFYFGNEILFSPFKQNNSENKKQTIYDIVSFKYAFLEQYTNTFMETINADFFDLFREIQKHYYAFAKLANIWKYKKSVVQIDHDLYMNVLDKNKRNVFSLLQQGKIYLFTSANLVSIINSALSNAPNFFVEPLAIKNPYNNVYLAKSDLYNIYFFVKQSSIIMPVLFHNFFMTNFDLKKFIEENENTIRHIAFESYVRNASSSVLYSSAIAMLKKYQKNIVVHKDFPKDVLINILRPYLLLHYIIEYSSEEHRVYDSLKTIKYKLRKLYIHNFTFGRKIVKLKRSAITNKMEKIIEFSSSHPQFNEPIDTITYQNTHLEIVEPYIELPIHNQLPIGGNNFHFEVVSPTPSFVIQNNLTVSRTYNNYSSEENEDDEYEDTQESDSNNDEDEDETVIEGDSYDDEYEDEV